MKLRTFRSLLVVIVVTVLAGFFGVASAQHRGSFFGSYRISNVADQGDRVQLTIRVVVLNYTGKEIKDCAIVLYNSAPVRSPLGTFSSISTFPVGAQVSITQTFTVSKAQYTAWKQGENPAMVMSMPEGDAGSKLAQIDLTPAGSPAAPTE